MGRIAKTYLIDRLLDENWFESEKEALPFIMAGRVSVDDMQVLSGREKVPAGGAIRVKEYYKRKYVNKGGLKLEHALREFGVDVSGKVALDCGASAGGFTDCLLRRGAKLVYAVDAGHGQLAGKLLIDERVVNMERTNISDAALTALSPKPELITLDLSYLSLKIGAIACRNIMAPGGAIIALIKPIYEVDSAEIRRSGDVNRREVLAGVLADLCGYFPQNGFAVAGLTYSPVRGNRGAIEYFIHLKAGAPHASEPHATPAAASSETHDILSSAASAAPAATVGHIAPESLDSSFYSYGHIASESLDSSFYSIGCIADLVEASLMLTDFNKNSFE